VEGLDRGGGDRGGGGVGQGSGGGVGRGTNWVVARKPRPTEGGGRGGAPHGGGRAELGASTSTRWLARGGMRGSDGC
jgi:hypothetical protein